MRKVAGILIVLILTFGLLGCSDTVPGTGDTTAGTAPVSDTFHPESSGSDTSFETAVGTDAETAPETVPETVTEGETDYFPNDPDDDHTKRY